MTEIEVFADVSCPFAHVGLRRWFERRDELGADDVRLRVRAWPLEIVNDGGLDGPHVAPKVAALQEEAAPDLFAGFDPAVFPASTLPALALTHAAYDIDTPTGERVAWTVRDELWERGRDVGDPQVLAEIAARCGVDPGTARLDTVRADLDEGRRRGVIGSPHFFGPGLSMFCPTLAIESNDGVLHVEPAMAAFDELAAACFGPSARAES